MAIEEEELQLAKEKGLETKDFEAAAAFLHRQDGLEDRIYELAKGLKGVSAERLG